MSKDNRKPEDEGVYAIKGKKVVEMTKIIEELNDILMDFSNRHKLSALELISLLKQIIDLIEIAYIENLIERHITKYISGSVRVGG
jgi:hypothetical protein